MAARAGTGGLCGAEPGALRLGRRPGRGPRAGHPGARRAEQLVARLRQPRRCVAPARAAQGARAAGLAARQFGALRRGADVDRGLSRPWCRDRVARPHQLGASGCARRSRRTCADRHGDGHDREARGPGAGWLVEPVDCRDRAHARSAARGRLPLRARLVHGRPAGLAADTARASAVGAVSAGIERQRRDHRPSGRRRRIRRHDRRPVRRDAIAGPASSRW